MQNFKRFLEENRNFLEKFNIKPEIKSDRFLGKWRKFQKSMINAFGKFEKS
jgi:hypothetical protein